MSLSIRPAAWDDVNPEWTALLTRARPPAGAFATPEFQSAWWDAFAAGPGADGCRLDLQAVRDGEELVGVLPLMRRDDAAHLIGDSDVCDYMDLVAAPGREADVVGALLDHLEAGGAASLSLPGLPHGSATLEMLPAAATARGWDVRSEPEAVCPVLALAPDWDGYLAAIRTRHRREVRRKMRNLLDGGATVSLEPIDDPEALIGAMPDFLALMAASRGDKADFLTPRMAAFFQGLARRMGPAGLLRLYFFHVDGKRAAAVLCFRACGELQMYNSGYDPGLRELSVGLASKVFVVRDAIERGLARVDFLRGEEPYKFQLGAKPSPVTRLELRRAGADGGAA